MKTDTETLVAAMRVLARDIQSEDGVANSAIAEAANRLEALYNALTGLAAVTFPNINFHPDDVKEAWEAAQEVIFAGRDDSDEAPIAELIRPFIKRAAEAATATGSANRLERLEKLCNYLEQPGVLMSIPQPVRMMISRLLHEE